MKETPAMNSIWAIATNTIKQALRLRFAVVFTILLIILLPIMGISTTGDGTIKGKLQTFVSYGLSLTSLLLCLLTIVVSAYSLTNDIKQKQIFTVLTKPIRRYQLLLGKLLGVILFDVVLLLLFSAIIYSITIYTSKFSKASEAELNSLKNEFLTARVILPMPKPDVTQQVKDTYEKLEKNAQLPPEVLNNKDTHDRFVKALGLQIELRKRAVEPGRELLWQFHNVKPLDPNQSIFVKFKYEVSVNPPDLQIHSRWVIGDDRQLRYGGKIQTPIYPVERKDLIRTFYEIEVPADAVADDGYLAVGFLNLPLNNTVVIFPTEGVQVLYKAGSFTANFIRASLVILLRLIFLACLGVLASTFLSFPVAMLFCLVIFFTASFSGFIIDSFDIMGENISGLYSYTIKPIVQLLPQFDKFNPTKFLVPATVLGWGLIAKTAFFLICVKAFVLLFFALLIFSSREIAKVIV